MAASAACVLAQSSAVAAVGPPGFTVAGSTSSLTATSMQLDGFAYLGQVTVAGQATLEFAATAVTMTGLALVQPCNGDGALSLASAEEAGAATLPSGFTVWVTDLKYSDGVTHAWTTTAQPAVGVLEPDGTTVTNVTATLLASAMPGLSMQAFRAFAVFCAAAAAPTVSASTPSPAATVPASPQPSAAPPATVPTPPAEASPSPTSWPTPSPAGFPTPSASPVPLP